MLKYLLFLLAGAACGHLRGPGEASRGLRLLLSGSVLLLLFFMGVGIGKDPHLADKIVRFGWNAFAVSSLAVAFSVAAVLALVTLFRRRS